MATADPANVLAVDDLAMMTGLEIRRAAATAEDVEALLGRLNRLDDTVLEVEEEEEASNVIELRESADDAPVVKLVHNDRGRGRAARRVGYPLRPAAQAQCRFASASMAS